MQFLQGTDTEGPIAGKGKEIHNTAEQKNDIIKSKAQLPLSKNYVLQHTRFLCFLIDTLGANRSQLLQEQKIKFSYHFIHPTYDSVRKSLEMFSFNSMLWV